MRKTRKIIGWTLIGFGLDCATPPYPSLDIFYLFPLYAWYKHITEWQQLLDLHLWLNYVLLSIIVGLIIAGIGAILIWGFN